MFSSLKSFRKLLYPFSIVYDAVTRFRNVLYEKNVLPSTGFGTPIVCVGNLSVGGTGKSPMVEYLLEIYNQGHQIAVLSRGYGRSTKGFFAVEINSEAEKVGDEPLQIKNKFPNATVAVCENRVVGINTLIKLHQPKLIVLDDGFQHRAVKPAYTILLTSYNNLYINDRLLPAGNLRESKAEAIRADLIVVTKCPSDLTKESMLVIENKLRPKPNQKVFFSTLVYQEQIKNHLNQEKLTSLSGKILLITGIANPKPLLEHLENLEIKVVHIAFKDHHNFSDSELKKIKLEAQDSIILTTEKDYMRLRSKIQSEKLYYLEVAHHFLKDQELFESLLLSKTKFLGQAQKL